VESLVLLPEVLGFQHSVGFFLHAFSLGQPFHTECGLSNTELDPVLSLSAGIALRKGKVGSGCMSEGPQTAATDRATSNMALQS
jgi:hypothetical protein